MTVGATVRLSIRRVLLFGLELVLAVAAAVTALVSVRRGRWSGAGHPGQTAAVAGLIAGCLVLTLYGADLYDLKPAIADAATNRRASLACAAASLPLALVVTMVRGLPAGLALAIPAAFAASALTLLTFRRWLPWIDAHLGLRSRVLLVGGGPPLQTVLDDLREAGTADVVGVAGSTAGNLVQRARAVGAHFLVLAAQDRRGVSTQELLRCRLAGMPVYDAAPFAERELGRLPVELVHPSDIIFGGGFESSLLREAIRRAVALVTALCLTAVAAPLMVLIAVLIKVDSPGPVLYRQVRVGRGGVEFTMLKFRTMRADAEADGAARWAGRADPRVTLVGRPLRRFRLDELPQLINVLRGEMGLVGPRPERPEFVRELRRRIPYYDLRHLVTPGITGWAQVRFPYAASLEEARDKLQYDLYYVKNLSVALDLLILLATVKVVLFGRGAR
jgi:sugar transferase (PEP-CTERM system associated)